MRPNKKNTNSFKKPTPEQIQQEIAQAEQNWSDQAHQEAQYSSAGPPTMPDFANIINKKYGLQS